MKIRIILFLLFLTKVLLIGQDFSQEWMNELTSNPNAELISDLNDILIYDLSHLWQNADEEKTNIGYIGNDFQRFYFHVDGIIKDKLDPAVYSLTGRTKVKDNICNFTGTIKIISAMKLKNSEREDIIQGYVICEYTLSENPKENHSGKFSGIASMRWYIDINNQLWYDDLVTDEPYYSNNVFVGIWQKYNSNTAKTCIWGQNRIPNAYKLDATTEGRFIPVEEYLEKGWRQYMDDYLNETNIENNWWRDSD